MTPSLADAVASLLKLTDAQRVAVEALTGGQTHAEAARAAGVARETVTKWVGRHPGVRASLGLYRAALAAEQADQLRRLRGKALSAIESAIDSGDADLALAVLKCPAVLHGETGSFPVNAEEILDSEISLLRANLPPAPVARDSFGFPDPVESMRKEDDWERARRVAVERLAAWTAEGEPPARRRRRREERDQ